MLAASATAWSQYVTGPRVLIAIVLASLVVTWSIRYRIGDSELSIRLFGFRLMRIPYSDIRDIDTGPVFFRPIRSIYLVNRLGTRCRVEKRHGIFRYIFITPKDPQALADAVYAHRARTDPPADPPGVIGQIPDFLRPPDEG
ncbi:MAG TPA: hypothetical protein VGH49_17385 [Xanthobacteraceae bacterium]|jgi:hypothetical protein